VRLYELPAVYREIDRLLEESCGEVDDTIAALLSEAESTLAQKIDAIAALVREKEARAEAERAEARHFAARAAADENAADRLKKYLLDCLTASGLDSAKGERFSARVQRNGTPSIAWAGEGAPPETFVRTRVEFDGRAAQDAYRAGTLPEGFEVSFGQHLRLR
jgi:hypothetical protein